MAREKLTAGKIRDFECPPDKGQSFLWDTGVPGLGIRATNRTKAFIFQGKLKHKAPDGTTKREVIRIKIGDVRSWVLDQTKPEKKPHGARQEAGRLKALLDQGIDPRIEKQERVEATEKKQAEKKRVEATVGDVWDEYIKARKHQWSPRHLADHGTLAQVGGQDAKRHKTGTKIKPGPLAELMPLKLSELTPDRVEAWAKAQAGERPARARLAFSLLRAFINWCDQKPEYSGIASPAACGTRIKRETIPRMKPKDDCLQREQLSVWFKAVRGLGNPAISAYLQTLLLIGSRREELARLKWVDVDFKWNGIIIHDKVEGERTIPLTPYVSSLLSALPRRQKEVNGKKVPVEWVFSSPTSEDGRIQEPRTPHNRALAVAGIEGLTLHGLRRSFGTLSEWVEVPAGVVAQIMGHKPSATAEKHYRRRPLDLLRMWHEKIETWILEQAGIEIPKENDKVIQLVK